MASLSILKTIYLNLFNMTCLSILKTILSNKNYYKIAINIFQNYPYINYKDWFFL